MRHNRKIIYLAGFLFAFPMALTSYINSSFLENYLNPYYISMLYAGASILTIVGMLKMPLILSRVGDRLATASFALVLFLSLMTMALGNKMFIIPAFILYFMSSSFIIASLDIFVEDFSQGSGVGRWRGLYISIINIGWVLSEIISGSIIEKGSFRGIYIISAIFMFMVSIIFILFIHNFVDPKYKMVPIRQTVSLFVKNKNISKVYFIDLIIKFFYAWMIIYTPIYLHQYLLFSWEQIGFIFTIMLLPFVFLSFPLGTLSDKIGEKKIMMSGLLIMSIATLTIPFITLPSVVFWALILLCTRIGAATSEAMTESYFFKVVNEKNSNLISFFRNSQPLSYIIAPLLAIPVLLLVPSFKYLFFALGIILLLGLFTSMRLKDVK